MMRQSVNTGRVREAHRLSLLPGLGTESSMLLNPSCLYLYLFLFDSWTQEPRQQPSTSTPSHQHPALELDILALPSLGLLKSCLLEVHHGRFLAFSVSLSPGRIPRKGIK